MAGCDKCGMSGIGLATYGHAEPCTSGKDKEIARLRQALTDILNPLAYLERCAKAEGANLNSSAPAIANNQATLQEIARNALR